MLALCCPIGLLGVNKKDGTVVARRSYLHSSVLEKKSDIARKMCVLRRKLKVERSNERCGRRDINLRDGDTPEKLGIASARLALENVRRIGEPEGKSCLHHLSSLLRDTHPLIFANFPVAH